MDYKGFPFQLSKNASHTPSFINIISGHKPCRTFVNLFQFFLKLIRMGIPDRASILQDLTHHTFISCFLHILGAGERVRLKKPSVLLALVQILMICVFHFKSFVMLHQGI